MLTLVTRTAGRVDFQEEWKLGQGRFVDRRIGLNTADGIQVIAYGDELEYIRRRFPTILMVGETRQVVWTGETAAFIINNLVEL